MFDLQLVTLANRVSTPLRLMALRPAGENWNVQDWRQRVADWYQYLQSCPARQIALYCRDVCEFSAAMFGCWHAGKTVWLAADNRPHTVARLNALVEAWIGDFDGALHAGPGAPSNSLPPIDSDYAALMVFTSGSSGEPVAIAKSLRQLEQELWAQDEVWGMHVQEAALVVGTVPHQHIYGLLFRVLWPLLSERTLFDEKMEYPETLLQLSKQYPIALISSPAFLKRLPEHLAWTDMQPLAALLSSGGSLPREAALRAHRLLGRPALEIFGSSETGGVAWRTQTCDTDTQAPWTPLPGVTVQVEDGLLAIRSPYLGTQADRWLSADHACLLNTGQFLLGDRADRIVKLEEKRVSLTAIENALHGLAEVAAARVLLLDGERQQIGAVVVLTPAGQALLAGGKHALNQALRRQLAPYCETIALPRRWRYVDALPANDLGKTALADLNALFLPPVTERWLPEVLACCDTEQGTELTLAIDAGLSVFDGHFPNTPILPGVAQLEWAVHFARQALPLPATFRRMEVIKFQQVITPGMQVQLQLHWRAAKNALEFRFHSPVGQHASGRLIFQDDHV